MTTEPQYFGRTGTWHGLCVLRLWESFLGRVGLWEGGFGGWMAIWDVYVENVTAS